LARIPANQKPSREIGPVRIVSHHSPTAADVVTLPPSLDCRQAKLAPSETIWEPKRQPPPPPGLFSRLVGRQPMETLLVRSRFTDTLKLPDIGTSVGQKSLLKEAAIPYNEKETRRVPPLDDPKWQPPRWMKETQKLRGNQIVHRRDLYLNKNFMARVYLIHHELLPENTQIELLVAVDKDHRLSRAKVLFPTMISHCQSRSTALIERLEGKRWNEITLEDWPERSGAEFIVDNIVRDVQLLLALDEMAK
jgi:hypothetical protein